VTTGISTRVYQSGRLGVGDGELIVVAQDFHPVLRGAIDLHCHSSPSIFPRKLTDWELVKDLKAAGMAGAVIKSHESQTADRAFLIRAHEPKLHIYGGLVCNYFTGGLSPYAVDAAIRLGAKCIWMPTISAQEHYDHFARKKTQLFQSGYPLRQPKAGLRIWDKQQRILPEVHDILAQIATADILLATGHLSVPEVIALTDAAVEHGVRKILVQHADMGIAPVPMEVQVELARKGAIIEKCYLACGPDFRDLTTGQMADSIRRLGVDSCVMVTDYGQAHNISPVEALGQFAAELLAGGITEAEVKQMMAVNPRKLLNM
jgi:hypothetical protein